MVIRSGSLLTAGPLRPGPSLEVFASALVVEQTQAGAGAGGSRGTAVGPLGWRRTA